MDTQKIKALGVCCNDLMTMADNIIGLSNYGWYVSKKAFRYHIQNLICVESFVNEGATQYTIFNLPVIITNDKDDYVTLDKIHNIILKRYYVDDILQKISIYIDDEEIKGIDTIVYESCYGGDNYITKISGNGIELNKLLGKTVKVVDVNRLTTNN